MTMVSVTYKVPEDVPISHHSHALLVIKNQFLPMACDVNGVGGASVMEFDIPTRVRCCVRGSVCGCMYMHCSCACGCGCGCARDSSDCGSWGCGDVCTGYVATATAAALRVLPPPTGCVAACPRD